jgi:DNA-binding LacI/PurR family transcriptional regulator
MKRIAGELGVSITTVSKVLNNREDIGHATRARVLAKVAELGYRPNAVARSLTLRRTHTLGIVIPDLMHSFFVEIVAGLESVASARGFGCCSAARTRIRRRNATRSKYFASARSTASSSPRPMRRATPICFSA